MECLDVQKQLDMFLDDELSPTTRLLVEEHLRDCPQCRSRVEVQQQIKQLVKASARSVRAPAALRQRILTAIDQQEEAGRRGIRFGQGWLRPRVLVPAVIGVLVFATFLWVTSTGFTPHLVREVVEHHVHYLRVRTPAGIVSSDIDTVRRWLSTQLAFPVPVPTIPGLNVVGGNIETVGDWKGAAILYRRGDQIFSLFILPQQGESLPFSTNRRLGTRSVYVNRVKGYTAVFWQDEGIFCGFVGHLPEEQALEYVRKALQA
ncbi:MAG: anti-sigma factor [Nitrospinota bacterium]|nr:MAG: anti-sigma factor [Nitrospinota bacterium]